MKKFAFNLETVLHHRENLEQKERDELSRMNYQLQAEIRSREDLRERLRRTALELSDLQNREADAGEVRWYCLYTDRLRHEIAAGDRRIARLERDIQAQKAVVIESIKKRKVLQSLKARKLRDYEVTAEREGRKTVDEIVVTRFARKDQ